MGMPVLASENDQEKLKGSSNTGEFAPPEYPTNPALLYLASLRPSGRRSMNGRLQRIAAILGYGDPKTAPWSELRGEHAIKVRTKLIEQGSAPATVNACLAALRGTAKTAWILGLMETECYERITAVKGVGGARLPMGRSLSDGELASLFDACRRDSSVGDARDSAILALLIGAGLRRTEAAELSLGDYKAADQSVKVRGKGNRERIVYLELSANEAVKDWVAMRGAWAGPLLCPVRKDGVIAQRGLSSQAIYNAVAKRAKQAEVSRFSPHDLRRSYASTLIDISGDLSSVQQLMGHADIKTTVRYDRRPEQAKRRVAEMFHLPYQPRE